MPQKKITVDKRNVKAFSDTEGILQVVLFNGSAFKVISKKKQCSKYLTTILAKNITKDPSKTIF